MSQAIGYIRVSTAEQATDGVSLEAQRTRIEAWCNANGYRLATVHTDAGISGKRADNRPAPQRALTLACKRRGTALVVYSLSRLARSTTDAISIAERLEKAGADLVSLSEKIYTTAFVIRPSVPSEPKTQRRASTPTDSRGLEAGRSITPCAVDSSAARSKSSPLMKPASTTSERRSSGAPFT